MPEFDLSPDLLALLTRIAEAIRLELGEEIDAYPGFSSPKEADPINRLFRAIIGSLLATIDSPPGELGLLLSRALHELAEARLAAEGWDARRVEFLLDEEPGRPDDWLAFLILSSRSQIEPIVDRD